MDILFTGNVTLLSERFYDRIGSEYQGVVFGDKRDLIRKKNLTFYNRSEEEELVQIFRSFNFETVIFFSYALDGAKKVFDELEKLEFALYQCRRNHVKNFFYIMSNDLQEGNEEGVDSRLILMNACRKLCRTMAEKNGMSVEILLIPYLYHETGNDCQLKNWVKAAMESGKLLLPGEEQQQTDFLCDEDLGELISRMLDEPSGEPFSETCISGGNVLTFREVAMIFEKNLPELIVEYEGKPKCIPLYCKGTRARKEYGWYPRHRLLDDLAEMLGRNLEGRDRLLHDKKKKRGKAAGKFRVILEQLLLLTVAELLNYWIRDNVLLNFMDFRLVYVVIMGSMNGLNAGITASVLSCIGYAVTSASSASWQILFYNVQNWLPFACYFLLGAILGYTRDKHEDARRYAKEEYQILEDKYVFLNGLYLQVLESKERFSSQVLGYKDSFGKMYSVVKKLNSTLPEQVFFEAVNVLEEILDNPYVAIYSITPGSAYARLHVCSKKCGSMAARSLNTMDYPYMLAALNQKETFINNGGLANYPAYATPVFRKEVLVGMILLVQADYSQMNMEFSNKFRIMTDMIRDSLIRAMDFYDQRKQQLEQTRILSHEQFEEILEVKRKMRQKQYSDYILLKLLPDGRSPKQMNDAVSPLVRDNDVFGLGENGELYLLLSQTGAEDVETVARRLNNNKIAFEIVKESL